MKIKRRTSASEGRVSSTIAAPTSVENSNFTHLVADIAWFGMALAATSRFLTIYAIRVGATPEQLSLLAALPGIALLFATGFSGWWRRHYSTSVKALLWPGLGQRLMFLLPAFTPFFPSHWQPIWLIAAITLTHIPTAVSGAIFVTMMGEAVSQPRMNTLLSHRSLALNVAIGFGALAFGIMLEHLPFPYNYQLMFFLSFVVAIVSMWHVGSVRVIFPSPVTIPVAKVNEVKRSGSIWSSTSVMPVIITAFLTHAAFFSIISITPLHMVKNLGADEGFMMLFSIAELGAGALVATLTHHVIRRIGTRGLISFAMAGTALSAVIFATATRLEFTLLAGAISGASWTAAASVGLWSLFYERVSKEEADRASVAQQQAIALGIFVGPLIGGLLESVNISLPIILLMGAAIRLFVGFIMRWDIVSLIYPLATTKPSSALDGSSGGE